MILLGDTICRRFFSFVSVQHRIASAFLTGLLFSTIFTYLFALLFASSTMPLVWANAAFLIVAVGTIYKFWGGAAGDQPGDGALSAFATMRLDADSRPKGSAKFDWLVLAACLIVSCWMMFATLDFADGSFKFSIKSWTDFGANLTLSQSFAVAHNFPTEHPFLPGVGIRYHFLYWFQAANLSFLGLNLVWSINLLSVLSMMALIVLIMTFVEVVFNSRPVARMSALLFFLAGSSLSYIPFLTSQNSFGEAVDAVFGLRDFVKSGFLFRGDDWGALTVAVYGNQRHLISGVAIFLLVLIYLVDFYRRRGALPVLDKVQVLDTLPETRDTSGDLAESSQSAPYVAEDGNDGSDAQIGAAYEGPSTTPEVDESENIDQPQVHPPDESLRDDVKALIFAGVLIAGLPYWNSAVFVSAAIVIGGLLVFFPYRRYLLILIGTAVVLGLPQLIILASGNLGKSGQSLIYWGYIVSNPSIPLVLKYIGWTFGIKLVLLAIALWFLPGAQRRLFLAISLLLPVVFLVQLSVDIFNNHKLLNVWIVFASMYAAYALWKIGRKSVVSGVFAVLLGFFMVCGAIIDLFPIHNDAFVTVPYKNDRLTDWLFENTQPTDLFLSDRLLSHPILFTGRRIYLGDGLFPWAAGYDITERQNTYKRMFQERDRETLVSLLNENNIKFVAIDDGLRRSDFVRNINESVYQVGFEKVFEDTEKRYGNLTIYRVPARNTDAPTDQPQPSATTDQVAKAGRADSVLSLGGRGSQPGQFSSPRGIAVDADGTFLVADTMNARIQKFAPDGKFVGAIGQPGHGEGQLSEPNSVAIGVGGRIYVADSLNHRLIEFRQNGTFVKEWPGPPPQFLGPRVVTTGPDEKLFVLDQGRWRVVALDPATNASYEWGKPGAGDGEFNEPTGMTIGGDRVYVADAGNGRIQVFGLDGKFLAQWPVPEWTAYPWRFPGLAFDTEENKLYVSSPIDKQILVFDPSGNRLKPFIPNDPDIFENPSAIAISKTKGGKRLYVVNTGSSKVCVFELPPPDQ
jgi:DNA-binding beta-propeller fold protein YncE